MTKLKKVASLLRLRPHTNSKKVATTTGKKKKVINKDHQKVKQGKEN